MDRRSQTGADAGAVLPQAKERLGLPAARRGKAGSSPRGFGGGGEKDPADTLIWDFKPPEL